ncbi:MAG TPA: PEGA domain-containing protein [Polyangiaceae bacterium]|nr:PEGA domain-containing protein [Polyangiaceae bacterium]
MHRQNEKPKDSFEGRAAVDERTPIMTTLLAEAECELHEYRACATHMAESLKWDGHNSSIRKSIEEMLTEAANEVGAVTLSAKVEGAEVSVDGQVIGKTPLDGPVYLDVGTRKIAVAKSGYATITREIDARKGTSVSLSIDLPEEAKASVPMTQAAPAARDPLASTHSSPPDPVPFPEIPPDPRGPNPLLLVTGGVVAVGGLVTGLVLNSRATSECDKVDRLKAIIGPSGCFAGTASAGDCSDIASYAKDGDRYRRIANISAVAGSAALVGTVAYWLWPRGTVGPTSTAARFNAVVAPGGAWVGMDSAF